MIEDSIRRHALSSPLIQALIRDRLHLTTKHDSANDYVVLSVINDDTPVDTHLQDEQSEALIQFDFYSKKPQVAKDIARAFHTVFQAQRFSDPFVNVQMAIKQNRISDFESDTSIYRESVDYLFYYNEV